MSNLSWISLVGKTFSASIGEPWDFVSSAGRNCLNGEIVAVSLENSSRPWLLCEVLPFEHAGNIIKYVAVINRYRGSQDIIDNLTSGRNATVHFVYPFDGHKIESNMLEQELDSFSNMSFLIGSISIDQ